MCHVINTVSYESVAMSKDLLRLRSAEARGPLVPLLLSEVTGQIVIVISLLKKKKSKKLCWHDRVEVWHMRSICGQIYLRCLFYI